MVQICANSEQLAAPRLRNQIPHLAAVHPKGADTNKTPLPFIPDDNIRIHTLYGRLTDESPTSSI